MQRATWITDDMHRRAVRCAVGWLWYPTSTWSSVCVHVKCSPFPFFIPPLPVSAAIDIRKFDACARTVRSTGTRVAMPLCVIRPLCAAPQHVRNAVHHA